MADLGLIGSIGGGIIDAISASSTADAISDALDVQGTAWRLGYDLRDVFGRKPNLPKFRFKPKDMQRMLERFGRFNTREGADNAVRIADKSNQAAVAQLEGAMDRLFGGDGSFDRQRDLVNRNTEDMLEGRLSQPARRQLARRAVASGASGLGEGAVDDVNAGYLGLATEDIVTRGAQQYQSLYQGYRQALPFVSAAEMMPYTSFQPGQAVNTLFAARENIYQANYNRALTKAAPDPMALGHVQAEMQRAMAAAGADAQAMGSIGGIFSGAMNSLSGFSQGTQTSGFGLGSSGGGGGLFGGGSSGGGLFGGLFGG